MNIYRLAHGTTEHIIPAVDEQDAYKQGTDPDKFPDIHYLPFTITQIVVPGHTITVTKDKEEAANEPLPEPKVPVVPKAPAKPKQSNRKPRK
jgi:hypothetical protein